jgi:hypothetical protein
MSHEAQREPIWENFFSASSEADLWTAISAAGKQPTIIELADDIELFRPLALANGQRAKLASYMAQERTLFVRGDFSCLNSGGTLFLDRVRVVWAKEGGGAQSGSVGKEKEGPDGEAAALPGSFPILMERDGGAEGQMPCSGQEAEEAESEEGAPPWQSEARGQGSAAAWSAPLSFKAKAQACEECLKSGLFAFGLYDEAQKLVMQAKANRCGSVRFGALWFEEAGVYRYSIKLCRHAKRLKPKRSEFPIVVTATECIDGLALSVSYPKGRPKFVFAPC